MKRSLPRLLLAGTASGCGKTTVSTALLRAFTLRGTSLRAFKCGPDYIDPMFHTAVLGIPSRNLDLFFSNAAQIRAQLMRCAPETSMALIEGVMGFYDGVSGTTDTASAAHLGRVTETPAVLVVRPKGQSLSLAAMLKGFVDFAPNTLRGVILNGVSEGMYPFYQEIVEKSGLRAYGFLPELAQAEIGDRHLGLVTAAEIADLQQKIEALGQTALRTIDLDGLLKLAESAPMLEASVQSVQAIDAQPLRIAIARDRAFCFYYEENLELLRDLGVEWISFSPLADQKLPMDIDGLYLGGGYPELYLEQLEQNVAMRQQIAAAVRGGMPTIAECGGFLYLHDGMDGRQLCGLIAGQAHMTRRLQHFGYITLTAQYDSLLARAGEQIRAHEFHYAVSEDDGAAFLAEKPNGKKWSCVHAQERLYAGYPHLYLPANPEFATRFLHACAQYRKERA